MPTSYGALGNAGGEGTRTAVRMGATRTGMALISQGRATSIESTKNLLAAPSLFSPLKQTSSLQLGVV